MYTPEEQETLAEIIEQALKDGATVVQACLLAKIDRQTFYNWCERDSGFSARMEAAKNWVNIHARRNIAHSIVTKSGIGTGQWYLERRDPEFKPKADVSPDSAVDKLLEAYGVTAREDKKTEDGSPQG